ncbi:unnamed protein product [Phyllotreta striolata]|uniref:Uncharacterized protein n=1 Tax=Phyllotreta striolata TaxID=444603 RepID=A0A9N9TER7_PHYSR|nr:unnamed protein product [Phyllotreta striolata]
MLRLLSKLKRTTNEETNSNNDSTNSSTEMPSETINSIIGISDVNINTDDSMKQIHTNVENVLENSLVEGLYSEEVVCESSIEEENSQPSLHNNGVNINLTMTEEVAISELVETTETEIIHHRLSEKIDKAEDIYASEEISQIKLPLKKRKHSVINPINHTDNVEEENQIEYLKHKLNYIEENQFYFYPSKPAMSIAEIMDNWPHFSNYPVKKFKTAAERKEIPSTELQ